VSDVRTWQVPGRVNLVGEHLDYNGGPSVPFAIDRFLTLKVRRRDDDVVNVWSTLPDGRRERATFATSVQPGDAGLDGWVAYPAGAVWALGTIGGVSGVDLVLESDLPLGAGLSSSAALTVGVVSALADVAGLDVTTLQAARLAQRAENDLVGAPTGLMDQLAVAFGRAGEAVVTDPLSDDDPSHVPFDVASAGLSLLVVSTGVDHSHVATEAAGGYAERREECERAAAELGLEHLARAGLDAVVRLEDPVLRRRTQHVFTETARVKAALRLLGDGDWEQLGTVLTASHASLRDDFEVSCAELDVAVEAALEAGALGARMTGGGFGGSAIALVPQAKAGPVRELVEQRYDALGWKAPEVFAVRAADGARRVD
jgi:galactokinase